MSLERGSYEKIIENLHDGLYFVDRDRVITYWNKAAELISGFTADEVIGRSCSDNILTHVDGDGNSLCTGMCPLAETIADEKPREAEIYMHHKDGHRIPVSVRVSTLTGSDDKIIGGIELFTDISNQAANKLRVKELEILGNRLRLLVENSYIIHENEKLHVTISIGATLVNKNDTIDSLIKRADTLLYKSKAAGRNCLTLG